MAISVGDTEPRRGTALVATTALATVTVGSALAVGAVHLSVLLVVSAVATIGCSIVLYRERGRIRRLPPPALVLLALAAWSAIQAVPIPIAALFWAAPRNADVWLRCLRAFGDPPLKFASLSLDPGASLVEALKWFTYAVVICLARWVQQWHGSSAVNWLGFGSVVIVALVTLAHGIVGATSLFGLYTPEHAVPRWGVPPILNPNNLSGYLNLGTFCGLGLLLAYRPPERSKPTLWRGGIGAGLALVVAVSVLAASRGGVLGLGLGVLLFAALVWVSRSGNHQDGKAVQRGVRRRTVMAGIVAMGGGVLLAIVGGNEATWNELWDSNAEKLRFAEWSIPLVKDFPLFGAGRGAFESVFPAYRPATGNVAYASPENFVIQWIIEWGAPAAGIAMVVLINSYRRARAENPASTVRTGAWVGIGVLLLQNLVDLALEVPAIVILTCAVLGSLYREPGRALVAPSKREAEEPGAPRRHRRIAFPRLGRRALAFAISTGGVLAIGSAAAYGHYPLDAERGHLQAFYQGMRPDDPAALATFKQKLRQAVLRHPAEPYFPLLGAIATNRTQADNPMPWIAMALERDPVNGRAHFVLAEILAKKGSTLQALMELRLAAEHEPGLVWVTAQPALRLTQDADMLERAVPDGPKGAMALLALSSAASGSDRHELRFKLLRRALARDPHSVEVLRARAIELLSAAASRVSPCGPSSTDQQACLEAVRQDANAIERIAPTSCHPLILRARSGEFEERSEEGERLLATECGRCQENEFCAAERVRLAAKPRASDTLSEAVRAYLAIACSRESPCARGHSFIADTFAARGDWSVAAEHYATAAAASDNAEMWLRAADAASRSGQAIRASQALSKAERRGARDAALTRRIHEQREQVFRQELDRENRGIQSKDHAR